ncbi:MAG: sugar transferase [Chloroflexia bacterium]
MHSALPEGATRTRSRFRRRWWLTAGLVSTDAAALAAVFLLAYLLRFRNPLWPYLHATDPVHYTQVALAAIPVWLLLFALHRLYDPEEILGGTREYVQIINACTIATVGLAIYGFLLRGDETELSRGFLAALWPLSIVGMGSSRFLVRRGVYAARRRGYLLRPAIVVGANEEGLAVARQLHEAPAASGVQVLGFVDDDPATDVAFEPFPVLGTLADLPDLIARNGVRELIVAGTALSRPQLLDLFQRFTNGDPEVTLRLSSGLFEVLATGLRVRKVGFVPLVTFERLRITGIDAVLKRTLDLLGSTLALVLLAPVLILIAIAVKATSRGPVLYRRRVLGQGGCPFDALKYRTMVMNGDTLLDARPELREELRRTGKLKEDPRVTPLGKVLRRYSLDELPQLWNVLLGQMSLVGPRMITAEELAQYGRWQQNLLTVKPGLTGLWQISGRSDVPYEERVRLDMHYIRNYTIWLDIQIIFQTVPAVLRGKGAY